jgi:hypothetical protein
MLDFRFYQFNSKAIPEAKTKQSYEICVRAVIPLLRIAFLSTELQFLRSHRAESEMAIESRSSNLDGFPSNPGHTVVLAPTLFQT